MSAFEDFVKVELPVRPVVQTDEPQESILVRRGAIPRQYVKVDIAEGEALGKSGGVLTSVPLGGVGADKNYTHSQGVASLTWDIVHNLNKAPAVTIVDSAGTVVEGDVILVDLNNVQLTFSAPFSGTAYIN